MGLFDNFEKSVSKARKRNTLGVNKFKGKMSESMFEDGERMRGNKVRKSVV